MTWTRLLNKSSMVATFYFAEFVNNNFYLHDFSIEQKYDVQYYKWLSQRLNYSTITTIVATNKETPILIIIKRHLCYFTHYVIDSNKEV